MPELLYRILIVDDCPEDRELYRRALSQEWEGENIFAETSSAEEALDLWETFRPDCVLLDYRLPGLDGLDLIQRFESAEDRPDPAIVMLTGQGDEAVAVAAMKTGAQDYLVKSRITTEALRRSVHNAIEKVRLQYELARKQQELERLATLDALTGAHNRRHFLERLREELQRARRYGTTFSLLMIDVDYFKHVNDNHGHLTGDNVLVRLGELLRQSLRSTDLAARYGGEEFCILAANTDLEGARAFAERFRELLAEQSFSGGGGSSFSVTCSVGVAAFAGEDISGDELIARADQALYQAKREGRNRVCVYATEKAVVSLEQ
jgi:diguanylate cyclase (GGDEF)-like protein